MNIDHIGYAVKKLDRAINAFSVLGFRFDPVIDDDERNIRVSFGEKDGYRIELVTPLDKSAASPVDPYLGSVGPTPYHICYLTDDLDAELGILADQGFKVILPPKEAVAFRGKRVAFLMNLGLGLIELVEK